MMLVIENAQDMDRLFMSLSKEETYEIHGQPPDSVLFTPKQRWAATRTLKNGNMVAVFGGDKEEAEFGWSMMLEYISEHVKIKH